jgi:adenylate cyclase
MSFLAKYGARIAVSLLPLLVALGHVTGLLHIGVIQSLDNIIYDTKLRWTMPKTLDPRIVIVDIDEKSLAEVGRWPWNRQKLALLATELLQNQKASLLGFDLVFAEVDDSSGLPQLKQLANNALKSDEAFLAQFSALQPSLDYDAQFAQAMRGKNVVLGFYFTSDREARVNGVLPNPIIQQAALNGKKINATEWDGYGANIATLAKAAPHAGFFNAIADDDGVVRSIPLLAAFKGDYYESLALALYRTATEHPSVAPNYTTSSVANSIDSIKLTQSSASHQAQNNRTQTIKVDDRAAVLVPYRGLGGAQGGSFQYISAADVLAKRLLPQQLSGKIILVGSSAPGLQDLRITPVGQTYPGVETHANVLSSMLDGKSIYKPDYALGLEVALLLLVGLILACVLPALSAVRALVLSLALLLMPTALNLYLFAEHGMVFQQATLLLLSFMAYMLNMSYGYFVESSAKRELTELFGSYVPPQLVDEMVQDPSNHSMKATNKNMTVMFCDLRGFTPLAENMEPTQLQHLLNDVFSRLTQKIISRRGTIDKYMGDCVMAFWGAPVSMSNHAELAVLTALDISQVVAQINAEHRAKGFPEIKVGIGINTGNMCVGDMGSFMRRSYTVVGDAVNIASRLESLTKNYDTYVLAGQSTQANAPQFDWLEVDKVQLEGKSESIVIYTLQNDA